MGEKDTSYDSLNLTHLIDLHDPNLYGNEAADDEDKECLEGYFVHQKKFKRFEDISNNFVIAKARKGVGKSALIKKTSYDLEKNNSILTICINGYDLSIQKEFTHGTTNELIFDW